MYRIYIFYRNYSEPNVMMPGSKGARKQYLEN